MEETIEMVFNCPSFSMWPVIFPDNISKKDLALLNDLVLDV
jgi:hypothetical protein